MKTIAILLILLLAGTAAAADRKSLSLESSTYTTIQDENISAVGAHFGCKYSTGFKFESGDEDVCNVAPGAEVTIHSIGVQIPILDNDMSNCRVCLSMEDVVQTETCVATGGSDLDEVGEFLVLTIPTPTPYAEGTETKVVVIDSEAGGTCDTTSDIKSLMYSVRREVRDAN